MNGDCYLRFPSLRICNARSSNGASAATHQSLWAMEGSMKMMSWSRYHCLSRSWLRAARLHRAARLNKIRRRSQTSSASRPVSAGGGFRAGCFQFIMRMFRT